MRRMQRRKDFPALSRTLLEINQLTADTNRASADQLANVILRDYAVTNKLLKLANSSFYARRSGSVTSISEAIRLLGMQQIRMIANSLLCFSQAGKDATNPEVRDLQTHAFLAGLLARHLAQQLGLKAHEEAFICGMLHTLGKSLVAFYLPEEYEEILQQVRNGQMQELAAAITVLGVSYEELGIAVAQSWEFPSTIIDTMPSIGHAPLPPTTDANQILHAVSAFANRLCTLPTLGTLDDRQGLLAGLVTNFESVVALEVEQAEQLLQAAMHKLEEFAPMLDLNLQSSPLYQHLLSWLHDASDGTTSTSPSISGAHAQRNSRVASGH
jgi:HD-like signal output (HDOD) protein